MQDQLTAFLERYDALQRDLKHLATEVAEAHYPADKLAHHRESLERKLRVALDRNPDLLTAEVS